MASTDLSITQGPPTLVEIASPHPELLGSLQSHSAHSTVYDNINNLQRLHYTDDTIAYIDVNTTNKVTLADIIRIIKRTYTHTLSIHYETLQHINTLAVLQETRVGSLATGKIPAKIFLKGTCTSVAMAHKQALATRRAVDERWPEVKNGINRSRKSVGELCEAIGIANIDVARRDKAYRDKVTGILAGSCLTGFATGLLVASVADAAASGTAISYIPALLAGEGAMSRTEGDGAEESRDANEASENRSDTTESDDKTPKRDKEKSTSPQKQIEAARNTWDAIGKIRRSTRNTAAATIFICALFNQLSINELATLMRLVQAALVVMERAVAAVERLSAPLEDFFKSLSSMVDVLVEMDERCRKFRDGEGGSTADVSGHFGKMEAEAVRKSWAEVGNACTNWLDLLHVQGIAPASFEEDDTE